MRFGIIGSNFITDWFLEAGKCNDDFTVTAVYSRSISKAEEVARKIGAEHCFSSLEELAACPDVDAVYIASPNFLHKSQTIQMLQAGKHVLCEKPVASNVLEFQEMVQVAKENNCMVMEAMRPLFLPSFALLKKKVESIGTVRQANLQFCQYSSRYDKFKNGIIENAFCPEFSNGALMDIGVYCVHTMVALFGKPNSISAVATKLHNGLDGQGQMTARYNDLLVHLAYSKISNSHAFSEIQGEEGTILFKPLVEHTQMLYLPRNGEEQDFSIQNPKPDMAYEIQAFIDFASGKQGVEAYNRISFMALEIMDEARKQTGITFPADRQ